MEDELHLKYNQINVLVPVPDDIFQQKYYQTIPPSFDEISTKLYGCIDETKLCDLGSPSIVGDISVCNFDSYPICTHTETPTLKDVLDNVAYHPEYPHVWIFITPKKYKVGEFYISTLIYTLQDGVMEKIDDNSYRINKCVDVPKCDHKDVIPKLSKEQFDIRYNKVTPIKIGDTETFRIAEKRTGVSYIWDTPNSPDIGVLSKNTGDLMTNDGKLYAKRVAVIPTFHTYGYYGLFKPSFDEVLSQLPDDIVKNYTKLIVTTNMATSDPSLVIAGDYHVGVTTFWTTDGVQSCETTHPVDEYNEQYCMVCLTNTPNTMVMPCGHVVVCEECSEKLVKSTDAKICVKCRREIIEVIYP